MSKYVNFKTENVTDFSEENLDELYSHGHVMTRIGKGVMNETVSLRIKLSEFELSSENRRILKKNEAVTLQTNTIPLSADEYSWQIHKLGKDFYTQKFGDKTFSAAKLKEILTTEHNFNFLLKYFHTNLANPVGYCICVRTSKILHYCYPFYDLDFAANHNNLGMGMMLKAILFAKENGMEYAYLGSYTREQDKYKLQFAGIEKWNTETQAWENFSM
jgi:arginyl-tRNA--protein-N-Asp/Glu arginylyltransferase